MLRRQAATIVARSASVYDTCTSRSASTKVAAVTSGPVGAAVPNATGAPGVSCVAAGAGVAGGWRHPVAEIKPSGAVIRNCRRVFTGAIMRA
jgi:hypothetical protein